ncbi:MAG TPA: zeta toxin family protein [Streptosporangiaceae bacterium]|nr:zeta toxin family protein [Streptosporangiaceae bacterium]
MPDEPVTADRAVSADRALPADRDSLADGRDLDRRDRPTPSDDLHRRLDQLPPGHPSSPNEPDGARRTQTPRCRDLDDESGLEDRPHVDEALRYTDPEWADHKVELRDGLRDASDAELDSKVQHTTDPDQEQWTPERDRIHGEIVQELYERASHVPCDRLSIIAGGLPGAGKTTILRDHAGIDLSKYLMVNPDIGKEELALRGLIPHVPGLSPMEASDLVHEESSVIAKQLAHKAIQDGKNLIWDITMSREDTTKDRIDALRSAGYRVDGLFIDVPIDLSIRRADARHREGEDLYRAGIGLGGRYVPPEVILAQADPDWGSGNRKSFESVNPHFDHWVRYDNSVDDRPAQLVETSPHTDGDPEETTV